MGTFHVMNIESRNVERFDVCLHLSLFPSVLPPIHLISEIRRLNNILQASCNFGAYNNTSTLHEPHVRAQVLSNNTPTLN